MSEKSQDNKGPPAYNGNKAAHGRPPTYSQARTTRPRTIRVAGTETVTMTPAQHDDAIEPLAVLIPPWHHDPHPAPALRHLPPPPCSHTAPPPPVPTPP